ncbi:MULTISPECIES: hypothetical protein [Nostocales]|uniref:Uncharacterized protein n=3 Tax=Nostocales TaxID=1161 RepID=A0A0C1QV25_9CYAN|nr:hypothetical protein [Tolypothrix bouteillei]KAF3884873.1 hypothetical protein DA73_0400004940 [Tolypothrix bouteillei VB521301]
MSQDNPNPQPPSSPEPKGSQSQQRVEQVTQPDIRVQSAWKSFIIRILRGTIGILEATANRLEAESPAGAVETRGGASSQGWGAVLGKIRSFLPENLSTKLSDTALTGIIAGIAVIGFWTTSSLLSGKPTEVATVPPTQETPPVTITTPPVAEEVPLTQPEEIPTPQAEEVPPPVTGEVPLTQPEEIPTPQAEETPPPVTGEVPPQVEESPLPEPTPTLTPEIVLTPEQTLIAAIENQVAEISDRFGSGLIQSIQANFRSSNLTVKISNEWYNLKQSQQDKLAADILQRSKDLDFSHLEIIDSQGRLVARNPVVGTEMIVFQRQARNT